VCKIKIGIIGSRRRSTTEDLDILEREFLNILLGEPSINMNDIIIVTGDCDEGGDFFAKYLSDMYGCKLDTKRIKDPDTGEEMDFKHHRWFEYDVMCSIFYKRDEEIAKEDLDYLLALVAPDRKGGTEKTIEYFKQYHKDWKGKLVIIL